MRSSQPWTLPNCFFFRHRYYAASGIIAVALHSILLAFMGNLAQGHVYSDYERLRSVVIGRADNFQLPETQYDPLEDEAEMAHNVGVTNIKRYLEDESGERAKEWDENGDADDYDDYEPFDEHVKKGTHGMRFPQDMIDERNQAMDNLASLLEGRGVKVWRTNSTFTAYQTKADHGKGDSTRDLMITIGDTLFLTPTPFRSRAHEVDEAFQHLLHPDRPPRRGGWCLTFDSSTESGRCRRARGATPRRRATTLATTSLRWRPTRGRRRGRRRGDDDKAPAPPCPWQTLISLISRLDAIGFLEYAEDGAARPGRKFDADPLLAALGGAKEDFHWFVWVMGWRLGNKI